MKHHLDMLVAASRDKVNRAKALHAYSPKLQQPSEQRMATMKGYILQFFWERGYDAVMERSTHHANAWLISLKDDDDDSFLSISPEPLYRDRFVVTAYYAQTFCMEVVDGLEGDRTEAELRAEEEG